jgi:hypothetical protein
LGVFELNLLLSPPASIIKQLFMIKYILHYLSHND